MSNSMISKHSKSAFDESESIRILEELLESTREIKTFFSENDRTPNYDGTFDISGGILVAAGSSGMAQMPSDSSSQKILNLNLTSQEANTVVNVKSSDGKNILTYAPLKNYSSVIVSTPDIKDIQYQ